ncbi:MAG: hypothetical protein ACRDHZ_07285 [Ktedonobacteraceae bacterium]
MTMQAQDPNFPQTISGALYPLNYVVAVIDDLWEAQMAAQAFLDAGYDMSGIRLMNSREELQKIKDLEAHRNWLQRFLASFQGITDETGVGVYKTEAQKGHQILHVHASTKEEIEQIRDILEVYHAHTIKFFGPWFVEDIPPKHVHIH